MDDKIKTVLIEYTMAYFMCNRYWDMFALFKTHDIILVLSEEIGVGL
jgi:hypothetical protein